MAKKILITGASGLIGKRLSTMLLEKGYEVAHLSRNPKNQAKIRNYIWDPEKGSIDEGCIDRTEVIIHLAGTSVADKKWTTERKNEIIDSRTKSIQLIYDTLSMHEHQVKSIISAGAIGYYGNRDDEVLTEESPAGKGFLAESCIAWEKAVSIGQDLGLRIVQLRVGLVLSKDGGALKPLERTMRLGLGAPLGNGKQWMSWIHLDDLCRIFIKAVESEQSSAYEVINAVAPNPVRNENFIQTLARVLQKPLFFPAIPRFLLKGLMGERSEIILDSVRVSNEKLDSSHFEFQFKLLEKALEDIYRV